MTINPDHYSDAPYTGDLDSANNFRASAEREVNFCPCCGGANLCMARTQPPVWRCTCRASWVMQPFNTK